jgi:hypothetical protein
MKVMKRFLKNENAIGLVEALVSIAIVGTGMVLITYFSLKSVKLARKNELKDIAVQTAVEAMDFMKQPGYISTNIPGATLDPKYGYKDAYKLDFSQNRLIMDHSPSNLTDEIGCSSEKRCGPTDSSRYYLVDSLKNEEVGEFCQQIRITPDPDSVDRYEVKIIVTWLSVGDVCEEYVLDGYRIGKIHPDTPG